MRLERTVGRSKARTGTAASMRYLAKWALGAAILVAAYAVYQRPEIQELFTEPAAGNDPLAFLENLPEITPEPQPKAERRPSAARSRALSTSAEDTEESEEYRNQIPNQQLARVLMQILGAKKLAAGVSLSVTDEKVSVVGEVDSEEQRRQILDIVDRGREARRVDGHLLKVKE